MKRLMIAVLLIMVSGGVHAQTREFSTSVTRAKVHERPERTLLGELVINNAVKIPAYALTVPDGFSEAGRTQTTPRSMRTTGTLAAKDAAQLAAYYTNEGWVVVPRSWQPVHGDLGANGSSRYGFAPASGIGKVTMYSNGGGCVGCSLSDASLFFQSARAKAKSNEFMTFDRTNVPVQKTQLRPNLVAYRVMINGVQLDGLDGFQDGDITEYFRQEVVLPKSLRHLATPILNWTVSQH